MPIVFQASLPANAETPIKPTTDVNDAGLRRVRIWLDGYMKPGDTELLLLKCVGKTFKVTVDDEP